MTRRRLSPIWALLLLGGAILWWTWPKQPLPQMGVDWRGMVHRGDQAASDVVMREYGADGALELLASAQTAWHEPKSQRTLLDGVHIERFRKAGNVDISGQHGLMGDGDQDVRLWGNVQARLEPDSTLHTHSVRYDPRTGVIASTDPVYLQHGKSRLQGIGLWASVKSQQFRLLSQVRGTYVP